MPWIPWPYRPCWRLEGGGLRDTTFEKTGDLWDFAGLSWDFNGYTGSVQKGGDLPPTDMQLLLGNTRFYTSN